MNILQSIGNLWHGIRRMAADRDPLSNFWYGDISPPVKSGIPVTESRALTYSAVWAATRLLSGTIGLLPLDLYRRMPGGGRELLGDDDRERLIHDRANGEMGAMMFRATQSQQQINAGNSFAEIERDRSGAPIALWPIHYSRVKPIRDNSRRLRYEVRNNAAEPTILEPYEVLHVASMMSDDGLWGKGVIRQARESIGFGIATEEYGASWFGNGAQPKVIVSTPKQMMPDARDNFRKEWATTYGGADGSKVGLLTAGMTATSLNISAEDQQFLETRQHNIEEIARWYGVPPHMIQHLLRATFNNIEHMGIEFVTYSLLPWLKLWEQECWAKLLTPEEQRDHYFEFNVTALLRGDAKTRGEFYRAMVSTGLMSPNEARDLENMNPYDGGDDFYMQGAMVPVDMLGQQPAQTTTASEPPADASVAVEFDRFSDASRAMLRQSLAGILRRDAHEARNAAKKPHAFIKWIDSYFNADRQQSYSESLSAPCQALAACGFVADAGELGASEVERSRRELLDLSGLCTSGELQRRVDVHVTQWETSRPAEVAGAISRTDQL